MMVAVSTNSCSDSRRLAPISSVVASVRLPPGWLIAASPSPLAMRASPIEDIAEVDWQHGLAMRWRGKHSFTINAAALRSDALDSVLAAQQIYSITSSARASRQPAV